MRYVICGAAPLSKEMLESFQDKFGIRILEGYGLTETTCVSSINPYYGEQKAGLDRPAAARPGDADRRRGRRAASRTGERGEIVIKGPNVMMGYLKNEESTSESLRDGWLYTGDVGVEDEDGYFFIVDRTKDMIIRGGENIYPREIEEVLYQHEGVLEAAVIGVPDDHRGEEVLADRRAQGGRRARRRRAARVHRRAPGEVQGAQGRRDQGRAAQDPDGQDLEGPAARAVRALGRSR